MMEWVFYYKHRGIFASCVFRSSWRELRIFPCFSRCRTTPRCGFPIFEITQCGLVCFIFGESHGAVRRSFHVFEIRRCGAVRFFLSTMRCGADFVFVRIIRCGAVSVQQLLPTGKVHAPYRKSGVP